MNSNAAIIVAAGVSARMGSIDKAFINLAGRPLICHSVDTFLTSNLFDSIVVVVAESKYEQAKNVLSEFVSNGVKVVIGGSRRQDSVRNGLEAISKCTFVAIHDGARPCVALDVLKRGLDAVEHAGAVVPAVPVVDTFKRINELDQVLTTLERNSIRLIQTPQIFKYDLVFRAHRDVLRDSPDDAFMVEQIGEPVTLFDGDPDNIKITRPIDLKIAESILISNRGD